MAPGAINEAGRETTLTVPRDCKGKRFDLFLAERIPLLSRTRVQGMIENGEALIDGADAKPSARLKAGSLVTFISPQAEPEKPVAEAIPLDILFEDEHMMALNKPAGMSCHPSGSERSHTLVNALLYHCRELSKAGGETRPGIVHRLDKGTSGVMVVAKTEEAHSFLASQFKRHLVQKRYHAIVLGNPGERGKFNTFYGRHPLMRQRFSSRLKQGKEAVTEWRCLESFEEASLVEAIPLTGRSHQIRVHFADSGHPVLGDPLYVSRKRWKREIRDERLREAALQLGRQALHSLTIELPHPATRRALRFSAGYPADFAGLLSLLRQMRAGGDEGKNAR